MVFRRLVAPKVEARVASGSRATPVALEKVAAQRLMWTLASWIDQALLQAWDPAKAESVQLGQVRQDSLRLGEARPRIIGEEPQALGVVRSDA